MPSLLWVLILTAAPPPSVAVNELSRVNVSPELAAFAAEHVGQALSERGLKVITSGDIAASLGLERQRQLLGCSNGNSCLAELAQALGADFVLTGSLAKLGTLFQLNLKLVDARTSTARSTFSGSTRDEGELPGLLSKAAGVLASGLSLAPPKPKEPPAEPIAVTAPAPMRAPNDGPAFWVPLGLGLAAGAAGGVCLGLREAAYASLTAPATGTPLSDADATAARNRGKTTQLLAPILGGVGVAAVATALVLRFTTGPQLTATLGPGGVGLGYAGSF